MHGHTVVPARALADSAETIEEADCDGILADQQGIDLHPAYWL